MQIYTLVYQLCIFISNMSMVLSAWKVSVFKGVFLVRIFPHSDYIRTRKTSKYGHFHTVGKRIKYCIKILKAVGFVINEYRIKILSFEDGSNSIGGLRSSHRRCSIRKDVLRNFAKFIGKHLCQSPNLNKVAGLRPATLLKKRLWILRNF